MTPFLYIAIAIALFLTGVIVMAYIHNRCDVYNILYFKEDLYFACFWWAIFSVAWMILIPAFAVIAVVIFGCKFLVDLICKLV